MDISPLQRHLRATDLPLDKLAGNAHLSEADKVNEASRQFEAVLLRQVLQEGQKTVFRSRFSQNSTANSIYQDLITNELADGISKSGTLGLGHSLQRQLGRQLLSQPAAPATVSASAPPEPTNVNHD